MTAVAERRRRGSASRPPKLDPVTRYARDVTEGRILTGRAVRLACARHLRDLDRQQSRAFPFHFDATEAKRAITFFPDFLILEDGPFELLPWQQFIIGSLFGWLDADGARRFRTSFIETAKGTGKTPLAAGVGLLGLIGDNEPAAEIYSLGVVAEQATYLFKYAHRMATDSVELSDLLDIGAHNIAWLDTHSFFRALSSEGRSLDNKKPHFALVDEVQEHRTSLVVDKMRLGFKGRRQPLLFMITNSGFDRNTVCWNYHDLCLKVLDGALTDERLFAYICQLDACEACRDKGRTQADETCPDCDHWTDERVWIKACPSLGVTVKLDYLRGVVLEAQNVPAKQGIVKRLNFCLWTEAHTIWIPADRWDACKAEHVGEHVGVPCAAAFDLSMKTDLTACVIAQRIERRDVEDIEIDENDGGTTIKRLWSVSYDIELTSYFWLPLDTLIERVKADRIPYDLWRTQGHLTATPGPVVDHHFIRDQFINVIGPRFKPQRIGYDPYNATELAVDLRDRGRYTVVEVTQGRKLSEFVKLFDALVRMGRIRHNGNPVLAMCVANAEPKYDRFENVWLEKPSEVKRIDGAVAAIMALSQVVSLPLAGGSRYNQPNARMTIIGS